MLRLVTVCSSPRTMVELANFRLTVEVKGHVYKEISGQKYEFPVFTGKITHTHTVCTTPFFLPSEGLGTRLG